MADRPEYVVLTVIDHERTMSTYGPQVAMAHEYESMEDAAVFNVGSHPDAQEKGNKPYKRVVVIPWEHWHVFDVYSESKQGHQEFAAYPTKNPPIRARSESPDMD